MSTPAPPSPKQLQLRVSFDWGSGVCLWSANPVTEAAFGDYPVETSALNLPAHLTQAGEALITRFDESLNWDDPGGAFLWDDAQWASFYAGAHAWLQEVRLAAPEIDFIDAIDPQQR